MRKQKYYAVIYKQPNGDQREFSCLATSKDDAKEQFEARNGCMIDTIMLDKKKN